jgi:hypothetical protein
MLIDFHQGFFYGYYDGITGLVREPMEGAKKGVSISSPCLQNMTESIVQGFLGAIKGAGRSCKSFDHLVFKNSPPVSHQCKHETRGGRSGPRCASYSGCMEKYAEVVGQGTGAISA